MKKAIFVTALLLGGMLLLSACGGEATPTATPSTPVPSPTETAGGGKMKSWSSPPPMTISQDKAYTATISTNLGDITVELFPKDTPLAVNNFVFLSREGFYEGVKVHRIINGFMFQTGDPTGTGRGGPGYRFADEEVKREYVKGALAMANAGPDTNGSQFFITLADHSGGLPKNYTLFGQVTGGMDVVDKVGNVPVTANPAGEMSSPTVDVHLVDATITEK